MMHSLILLFCTQASSHSSGIYPVREGKGVGKKKGEKLWYDTHEEKPRDQREAEQ